mmetsp:Transcript_10218/g.42998  ORF Transcript_10218/g.42998 Transcript_10218/m.42998 type:complete len:441 (+) Transcript_10218:439-1761(+)
MPRCAPKASNVLSTFLPPEDSPVVGSRSRRAFGKTPSRRAPLRLPRISSRTSGGRDAHVSSSILSVSGAAAAAANEERRAYRAALSVSFSFFSATASPSSPAVPRALSPSTPEDHRTRLRVSRGVFSRDAFGPPPDARARRSPSSRGSRPSASASSDTATLANKSSSPTSRVPAGNTRVAGTAPASTPAARSASASLDASKPRSTFPVPEAEGTTKASHALTGTSRDASASIIEASAAYAAAEAARVAANRAEARASSSPGGSASRWSRTAKNTTRRYACFFSGPGLSGAGSPFWSNTAALASRFSPPRSRLSRASGFGFPKSAFASSRSCVGATSGASSSSSASGSLSVSPPSSAFSSSANAYVCAFFGAANAAMRLCPGSSVPSSAKDAHGSSFPAFRDSVTHAGRTTGGWFRSAFFNAASLAAVKPAHTMCVTETRE